MDPAPRPPNPSQLIARVFAVLLAVGAVIYAVFLVRHSASFASGSDASGYFNSARLLSEGRFWADPRLPAGHGHTEFGLMAFQPLGFIMDLNAPRMAPTYPTGLPLHLLIGSWLGGWNHASTLVNLVAAFASGALVWLLGRRLELSIYWTALGVALLWLCPLFLFSALQPMSDVLALVWSLAALYAVLRSRDGWRWSLGAGFALSMAVLVRPSNALLVLPVAVALGIEVRRYLWLALGGVPGGAFFGYYNWHVYGSPWKTGYGDVSTAFSRDFVAHNLAHFAHWIPALLTFFVCAALVAPFLRAGRNRDLAVLGLWAAILTGFYAFYYHSGETWWYLRFILPAFPVFVLAALVVLQCAGDRVLTARWSWILVVVVAAIALTSQVRLTRQLSATAVMPGEGYYMQTAAWAREHLPPNAVLYSMQVSGSLYFYSDFMVVRWDQIIAGRIPNLFTVFAEEHRPVYAVLYEFETKDAFKRLGGTWKKIGTVGESVFWKMESTSPPAP
ncbi:MAG TPA: hypothetical protein VFJ90_00395 [Candidatus Didemnitutus sp.]|nr:hypothetical protein [Candidatus Didemnitutus sp.]